MQTQDYKTMTSTELVALFNQHSDKKVKKFSDHGTAVKRVTALMANVAADQSEETMNGTEQTQTAAPETTAPADTKADKKAAAAQAKADAKKIKDDAKAAKDTDKQTKADARKKAADDKKTAKQTKADDRKKAADDKKAAKQAAKDAPKGFKGDPIEDKIRPVREGTKIAQIIDLISRPSGATMDELQPIMSPKATVRGILAYDLRTLVGYGYKCEDGNVVHIVYPAGMRKPMAHTPLAAKPEPKPKGKKKAPAATTETAQ